MIVRQNQIIPPHGNSRIEAGDHVILVLRSDIIPLVTKVFAGGQQADELLPPLVEFPLRPNVKVGELENAYGIRMDAPADWTLAEAIRNRLSEDQLRADSMVRFGPIALHVRGLSPRGTIEHIGMVILLDEETPGDGCPGCQLQRVPNCSGLPTLAGSLDPGGSGRRRLCTLVGWQSGRSAAKPADRRSSEGRNDQGGIVIRGR